LLFVHSPFNIVTLCSPVDDDRRMLQDVKRSAYGAWFEVWQAPSRAKADPVRQIERKRLDLVKSRLRRRTKNQNTQQ